MHRMINAVTYYTLLHSMRSQNLLPHLFMHLNFARTNDYLTQYENKPSMCRNDWNSQQLYYEETVVSQIKHSYYYVASTQLKNFVTPACFTCFRKCLAFFKIGSDHLRKTRILHQFSTNPMGLVHSKDTDPFYSNFIFRLMK